MHSTSSDTKPISLIDFFTTITEYAKVQPFDNQWYTPSITIIPPGSKYEVTTILTLKLSNYFQNVIWAQYSGIMAKVTGNR